MSFITGQNRPGQVVCIRYYQENTITTRLTRSCWRLEIELPDQVGEDLSNSENITNNLQMCYDVNT